MPSIVHHGDQKIAPFIRSHYNFFPFEASPLGDITFSGELKSYLKELQPLTFEQLLVEIAGAPDTTLLYAGHANPDGIIMPVTAGSPVTQIGLEVLEGLPVFEQFVTARKSLMNSRPPAPKPLPGHKGPPPKDQATKNFLKKVADLVHDMEAGMMNAKLATGTPIDVSQLKTNIDNDEPDVWQNYNFSGPKPPQDLVQWCNQDFVSFARPLWGFPSIARIEQFYDRVSAARSKGIRLEIRACRVGQNEKWVKAMRKFLGPDSKVAAPVCYVTWGGLSLRQLVDDPKKHVVAVDQFKSKIQSAQASTSSNFAFRLFMHKAAMAPAVPPAGTAAPAPGPTNQSGSPAPQGAPDSSKVTQPPSPQGASSGSQVTQPPGPTINTATVLVTATEKSAGDLHNADYASWFVKEKHFDDFVVDYGMDGKAGFRVPKGKTKWQADFQWFWTDNLANVTDPNAPPPSLPTNGFNVPYSLGGTLVKPIALQGDPVYRKLIRTEP
jgi:hypothetical protein